MEASDNQAARTPPPVQSSSEDDKKQTGICRSWHHHCTAFSISSLMKGATDETVAPRKRPNPPPINDVSQSFINLTLAAEAWRFIAYCFFWAMVIFAIILTRTMVVPKLAAGPDKVGDSCGPFNRENPGLGVPFDFYSQNHLIDVLGYTNICAYWDYSPAREIVAMFYPVFEYSIITYIVLDFLTIALAYQRGELTEWFWKLTKIFFPILIILCAWFRLIFVFIAYENAAGHTAGFVGLQVALIMNSIQNGFYILHSQVAYQYIGGLRNTRVLTISCLICNLVISGLKLVANAYVVLYGKSGGWFMKEVAGGSVTIGRAVDWIWMFLNAVIPMIVSYFRAKSEYALNVRIDMKAPKYLDEASVDMESGGDGKGAAEDF